MKDATNNIEIIKSILYSDFFKPPYERFDEITSNLLEENYPFITLVGTFASGGLTTFLQNAFLNHLISSFEKVNYMEIGLYHGSSLLSALSNNEDNLNKIVTNDKWEWGSADYDVFERNITKVLSLYYEKDHKLNSENERIIKLDNTFDVTVVRADVWQFADTIMNQWGDDKVDIYFYDGDHSFESQRDALIYFQDCFADEFIYLVDDWKDEGVVKGTHAGIEKIGYEVLFSDNTHNWSINPKSSYGWGGGQFIAYLKKVKEREC